jgi:putative DNA primase/helicase
MNATADNVPDDEHDEPNFEAMYSKDALAALGRSLDSVGDTSEDALAADFAQAIKDKLRHVGQWAKWLSYEQGTWRIDHNMVAYYESRMFLRAAAKKLSKKLFDIRMQKIKNPTKEQEDVTRRISAKATKIMRTHKAVHSIASLARTDPKITLDVEHLDSDPWLLNTPDGTVDLRTGDVRKHNPLDYITKRTAAAPGIGKPEQWITFLTTIMKGDLAMVDYLQKVFGYCLVGEVKEHEMYFGYGTGANGKGVTLNTMRDLLGDYGMEASIETFIVNPNQRHPTELADLRGARLVTCGETDEGQRWAEARIKMLTGGDPVKARFMRQDFFEFRPQFKLFLAGNHKPKLSNVDEAIERRFRLIPFTYTVPKSDRDVDLGKKLRAEWPQILHWCIEGCLRWQSEGLAPPAAVAHATRSYLNQEDAMLAWKTEELDDNPKGFTYIKDLYDSWRNWARENGETAGTKRQLTLAIEDREPIWKYTKGKRNEGFGFHGVVLKDEVSEGDVDDDGYDDA